MRPVAHNRKNWLYVGSKIRPEGRRDPIGGGVLPQAWPSGERVSVSGVARHESEKTIRSRSSHPASLEGISAKPLVRGPQLTLRAIGNINSLIRVTVQNVIASIGSFGIGREKPLISLRRNAPIAINVARAEFQI